MITAILDNPITRLLFKIATGAIFFSLIFFLFPLVPFPSQYTPLIINIFSAVWAWDFIIPVGLIFYLFGISLFFEFAKIMVHFIIFVWDVIVPKRP
jgi:hypothetical protein